jgi:hypothetical protein
VRASRMALGFLLAAALLGGASPAVLAAGDPHSCVAIPDDAARLACYDRAMGRTAAPKPAPVAPAAQTAPAAPAAAAAATAAAAAPAAPVKKDPVGEFGLSEQAKQAKDPAKAAEAAAAPDSITGRVMSLRWRKYGEFVVTLDNAQVWAQIEPMPSAVVRVGDTVTIKKALFGSYTLVTAGRIGTKVRRID